MHISRQLLAHNPKYGWKLEMLRGISLGAKGQGVMGAKCWVWRWV